MLFSSYEYILFFLPVSFFVYFFLNKKNKTTLSKVWLVASSLFFYSWFNIYYLPILISSVLINYGFGITLSDDKVKTSPSTRRVILVLGIFFNISLLGYFKYTDFLIENYNIISGSSVQPFNLLLPLALSFITFQMIAYLVDAYNGKTRDCSLLTFALFASFFPQQIAGPIVHHSEMMPQFASHSNMHKNYSNIGLGLYIFAIGLFKKVIIADSFAVWADSGFTHQGAFEFHHAWVTSLSYTFQLYFDFSGYTDMAIGSALLFNIRLPINFNSPYKSLNIQDFWRRWHITLSRFLRDYIYIPFGGNRKGKSRTYMNLFGTFLIGGIWHGASWMFVIWGAMHGGALVIHRLWDKLGITMPKALAWLITFNFVNLAWIFFRATDLDTATRIIRGMTGMNGMFTTDSSLIPTSSISHLGILFDTASRYIGAYGAIYTLQIVAILATFVLITQKNTSQIYAEGKQISWPRMAIAGVAAGVAIIASLTSTSAIFLYFNF